MVVEAWAIIAVVVVVGTDGLLCGLVGASDFSSSYWSIERNVDLRLVYESSVIRHWKN